MHIPFYTALKWWDPGSLPAYLNKPQWAGGGGRSGAEEGMWGGTQHIAVPVPTTRWRPGPGARHLHGCGSAPASSLPVWCGVVWAACLHVSRCQRRDIFFSVGICESYLHLARCTAGSPAERLLPLLWRRAGKGKQRVSGAGIFGKMWRGYTSCTSALSWLPCSISKICPMETKQFLKAQTLPKSIFQTASTIRKQKNSLQCVCHSSSYIFFSFAASIAAVWKMFYNFPSNHKEEAKHSRAPQIPFILTKA